MKKTVKVISIIFLIGIMLMIGTIFLISHFIDNITHRPEIIPNPKIGEWYRITPDGAISSDGSEWHGLFRKGSENKVIVYFYGGGFAAALLGNDTISNYFPNVKNTTVFAEASFLLNENWRDIAENVWQAPNEISERLVSNNIVLDSFRALSKDHPDTKILFSSSVRDNALSSYQNYYTNRVLETGNEIGDVYQENLKLMVKDLQSIPNTGVLIWDGYNDKEGTNLTGHTLMFMPMFYSDGLHGITMAEWVMNGINGNVGNHGLDLLDKQY